MMLTGTCRLFVSAACWRGSWRRCCSSCWRLCRWVGWRTSWSIRAKGRHSSRLVGCRRSTVGWWAQPGRMGSNRARRRRSRFPPSAQHDVPSAHAMSHPRAGTTRPHDGRWMPSEAVPQLPSPEDQDTVRLDSLYSLLWFTWYHQNILLSTSWFCPPCFSNFHRTLVWWPQLEDCLPQEGTCPYSFFYIYSSESIWTEP